MAAEKIEKSKDCRQDVKEGIARSKPGRGRNRENVDEFAAYAFDILQSLREASTQERHRFLGYLMGLAAEEAIRLAEGQQSAAAQYGSRSSRQSTPPA